MKFKIKNNMSIQMKASIALMITQLVQKGLQIITAPIYTRLLSTYEYGQVSLFFSWYEIMVIFTGLCLSKGVFNNGMIEFKNERDEFTLSMYMLTLISSGIVGTTVILICKYIFNFMNLPLNLIIYMFFLLAFEAGLSLWTVKQRFEYKWKATTIATLLIAFVSPLFGILCIYLFSNEKIYGRIYGERSVFFVAYIIVNIYLFKKTKFKVDMKYWKFALLFNLPLIPHYLSLNILNHMDQIMIVTFVGSSAAGIYSVAYSGASAIKIFWQSINASLIPWTYEKCEKEDFQRIREVIEILILGFAIICISFMFLAPEAMKLLAPSTYYEGIYIIPSVVAGVFFSALYYIFANIVYYYKKPKYVMIGSIVSAISNIILNTIFIPVFGYIAAGYTTMVSYILQVIIDYFAMKHIVKKKIYNMHFIVKLSFAIIMTGIMLSFVYEYTAVRIILFVLCMGYFTFFVSKHKNILVQFLGRRPK